VRKAKKSRRLLRPAAIVGLLVGLAVGVATGLGIGRSFDTAFRAALVGALVGGALAVVGGYLGSKELIDRDDRRERQDLIAAIQVARSEISFDAALLGDLIAQKFEKYLRANLHDSDFRQVNVALARGLPFELFADVSVTMNAVRRTADKLRSDKVAGSGGIKGDTARDCQDLLPHLNRINKRLLDHLRTELKVRIADAPNPFLGQGT
jgi:hypothetical protein